MIVIRSHLYYINITYNCIALQKRSHGVQIETFTFIYLQFNEKLELFGNVFNCHENNVMVERNLNGTQKSLISLMQNWNVLFCLLISRGNIATFTLHWLL